MRDNATFPLTFLTYLYSEDQSDWGFAELQNLLEGVLALDDGSEKFPPSALTYRLGDGDTESGINNKIIINTILFFNLLTLQN